MTITDERDTTEETAYGQCSEKCEDEFERLKMEEEPFYREQWTLPVKQAILLIF